MLSKQSPYAIYTPAISTIFARLGYGINLKREYQFTEADLNFLSPKSGLFHYPYALYSAGQAAKTTGAAAQKSSVSERDRSKTTIIGDSGGYQIQEDSIRFQGQTTNERMLRWLEGHADFSMTLDFPTGGISTGKMAPHAKRLIKDGYDLDGLSTTNGLSIDYNACLQQSLINLDYFKKHRSPGATNLLNVIQGRNERESKFWYEAVKGYDLEGWSFAGVHQSSFTMLLNRLIDMKQDGFLQRAKWIHVLGVSKLENAYLFTTILQCIRQLNPDVNLSFDTASPFRSGANLQLCTGYQIQKDGLKISSKSLAEIGSENDHRTLNELCSATFVPVAETKGYAESVEFPDYVVNCSAKTAIGERIRVSLLYDGLKETSSFHSDTYVMLMNHNVQSYLNAFAALNEGFTHNRLQDQVPVTLRTARKIIEMTLGNADCPQVNDPHRLVQECAQILDSFAE